MENEDRGKILFEVKHPYLMYELFWKTMCWMALIGFSIGFLIVHLKNLIYDFENTDFSRMFIMHIPVLIIWSLLGFLFSKFLIPTSLIIFENGIQFPIFLREKGETENYFSFNDIISIVPTISYPKKNIILKIRTQNNLETISLNVLKNEKGLSVIKNILGSKWNNVYDKFGLISNNLSDFLKDIKKKLKGEDDCLREDLNDNEYKQLQKSWKYYQKREAYSDLTILIKYEQDTGKKIIPEDIEVPKKLYEIAKNIDLDL